MAQSTKFWLLIIIMLGGGALINFFEWRGEPPLVREKLRNFPNKIGFWQSLGKDTRFDAETEKVLRADDYLLRDYVSTEDKTIANLYVGFYASQKNGATYHSPLNCLPGAGWEFIETDVQEISMPSGEKFTAQIALVRNASRQGAMIYWYQGRGRRTAGEYRDKILTVWDGITQSRSDGALVRVFAASSDVDDESAKVRAVNFASQAAKDLEVFVP